MDKDKLLDLSASIGKFNVENSNLLRDEKEYIKSMELAKIKLS